MQFTIPRSALLKPLSKIVGVLEKRQSMPILANILVEVKNQRLSLTATDLEIEMIARVPLEGPSEAGRITIPGKKWIDVCKSLPEQAHMNFELAENRVILRANRSRFTLACLPAQDFPNVQESPGEIEFSISQAVLRQVLEATCFAMAHQDVRYYLNGLLFVFNASQIQVVATDGHRLVTLTQPLQAPQLSKPVTVIVPRKAIIEMQRLFSEGDDAVGMVLGKNHLRVITPQVSFITKLIEGRFPDYQRILPTQGNTLNVPRETFKQALLQVSALFSDKYRGVGLQFQPNLLKIIAVNADKDEVEDELEVAYEGPTVEIGANASYLLEYLHVISADMIKITFTDPSQVMKLEAASPAGEPMPGQPVYAVMPMRL
jgi:DNA polymerase-3 subunit beta